MDVKTYSYARQNLAEIMDEARSSRAPVIITQQGEKPVVVLSLDEYKSMEETLYLLRSPANAARLYESIEQIKAGKIVRYDPTKKKRRARR